MSQNLKLKFSSEFDGNAIRRYVDDINRQINSINLAPKVEGELRSVMRSVENTVDKLVKFDFSKGDLGLHEKLTSELDAFMSILSAKMSNLKDTDFKIPVDVTELKQAKQDFEKAEKEFTAISKSMETALARALGSTKYGKEFAQTIKNVDELKKKLAELHKIESVGTTDDFLTESAKKRYGKFSEDQNLLAGARKILDTDMFDLSWNRETIGPALADIEGYVADLVKKRIVMDEEAIHITDAMNKIKLALEIVSNGKNFETKSGGDRAVGTLNAVTDAYKRAGNEMTEETIKLWATREDLGKVISEMEGVSKKYDDVKKNFETSKQAFETLTEGPGDIDEIIRQKDSVEAYGDAWKEAEDDMRQAKNEQVLLGIEIDKATGEQTAINIQRMALQWLGVEKAMQLAHRTLREVWKTYKDLDNQIGSIAMVTGKSVDESWKNVPEYNKMARQLAVTTGDISIQAEEFARQGRTQAETLNLIESTTKMGTIANMNFSDSLDYMTSAINGFNISAEDSMKVSDVFSRLDAVAATSVEELATALSKTSSIANSAGMDFEYTTAALTTMIETTREAPENLGTAMKSIIARMQEMKESPQKIMEDGVSANKVEEALKGADVALRDSIGNFRDLQDVLDELGTGWNDLERNTQRHIATMIAGNRQQSRFLALMENYDTTLRFYQEAQDAAGMSTISFSRKLDTLEGAINRLKTSLEALYLSGGLANILTGGVNALSEFIQMMAEAGIAYTAFSAAILFVVARIGISTIATNVSTAAKIKSASASLAAAKATHAEALAHGKNADAMLVEATARKVTNAQANLNTLQSTSAGISGFGGIAAVGKKIGSVFAAIAANWQVITILAAVAAGFALITLAVTKADRELRKYNDSMEEIKAESLEADKEARDLASLAKEYDTLRNKMSKTSDEKERMNQISQDILDIHPSLLDSYNAEGEAILKNTKELREYIRLKEYEAALEKDELYAKQMEGSAKGYSQGQQKIKDLEKQRLSIPAPYTREQFRTNEDGSTSSFLALDRFTGEKGLETAFQEMQNETKKYVGQSLEDIMNSQGKEAAMDSIISFIESKYIEELKNYNSEVARLDSLIDQARGDSEKEVQDIASKWAENKALTAIKLGDAIGEDGKFDSIFAKVAGDAALKATEEAVGADKLRELMGGTESERERASDLLEKSALKAVSDEREAFTTGVAESFSELLKDSTLKSYEQITKEAGEVEKKGASQAVMDVVRGIEEASKEAMEDRKIYVGGFLGFDEEESKENLDTMLDSQLRALEKRLPEFQEDVRKIMGENLIAAMSIGNEDQKEVIAESLAKMDFKNFLSVGEAKQGLHDIFGDSNEYKEIAAAIDQIIFALGGFSATAEEVLERMGPLKADLNFMSEIEGKGGKGLNVEEVERLKTITGEGIDIKFSATGAEIAMGSIREINEGLKDAQRQTLLVEYAEAKRQLATSMRANADEKIIKDQQNSLEMLARQIEGMPRLELDIAFGNVQDIISEFQFLGDVMTTQAEQGQISMNQAFEIIENGYGHLLSVQEGMVQLSMDGANAIIESEEAKFKASLKARQDLVTVDILRVDTEIAVAQERLRIAEEAEASGLDSYGAYMAAIDSMNNIGVEDYAVTQDKERGVLVANNGQMSKIYSGYLGWISKETGLAQEDMMTLVSQRVSGELEEVNRLIDGWSKYHLAVEGKDTGQIDASLRLRSINSGYNKGEYEAEIDDIRALEVGPDSSPEKALAKQAELQEKAKALYEKMKSDAKSGLEAAQAEKAQLEQLRSNLQAMEDIDLKRVLADGGDLPSKGGAEKKAKELKEYNTKLEKTYNILRQIELVQKQIASIELARTLSSNGFAIQSSVESQLSLMQKEIGYQRQAIKIQNGLMDEYRKELEASYSRFVQFAGNMLTINYDAIKKEYSGKMKDEKIEEIKRLEELIEKYNGAQDAVDNYNTSIMTLQKSMKDMRRERIEKVIDMENRLLQALIKRDEEELEKHKEKIQKMKDADASYLESVRRMREKEKQLRENEKDLESISKKRQRLAILERDTSGTYAREIAELKAEIASEEEELSQNRIDQIIADLEDESQKRADELDKQLNDLEKSHEEKLKDMSIYWDEVEAIMQAGTDAMLDTLMEYDDEFKNMSQRQKDLWIEDMTTAAQEVEAILKGIFDQRDELNNMNLDSNVNTPPSGTKPPKNPNTSGGSNTLGDATGVGSVKKFSGQIYMTASDASRGSGGTKPLYGIGPYTILGESGNAYRVRYKGLKSGTTGWFPKTKAYKKGGMVDYTGPAWVDGSKQDPEAFLSAEDTKNFLRLTEELRKNNKNDITNDKEGTNNFNVNVVFEGETNMSEEELARYVKQSIVNDPKIQALTSIVRR